VIGKDPLGNLEGEAAPCKVREWIASIWPIRIDKPGRLSGRFRNGVVVNNPNKDPRLKRLCNTLRIRSAAVNSQKQLNAIFYRRVERPLWDAVPICVAIRDEPFGNGADRTKRPNDDCRAGESVCIKVTNNKDRFTIGPSRSEARDQTRRIREELGGVERSISRIKESAYDIWIVEIALRQQRCECGAEIITHLNGGECFAQRVNARRFSLFKAPAALSLQRDLRACGAHRAPNGTLRGTTRARRTLPRRHALVPPDQQRTGIED
jgi:hypothetical protein